MKLTEPERDALEKLEDNELKDIVVSNERKKRRVRADKSAYAKACNDVIGLVEAESKEAIAILEKRDIANGRALPPGVPFAPAASKSTAPPPPAATGGHRKGSKKGGKGANGPPPPPPPSTGGNNAGAVH